MKTLLLIIQVLGITVTAWGDPSMTGLISWWRADGNANDSVGGHNGTLSGGMTFTKGVHGQAFAGGSRRHVFVPDSPNFQVTSFSVGAWVNIHAHSWTVIARQSSVAGSFSLAGNLDGTMHFAINFSGGTSGACIIAPISYDTWHQVTGTLDTTVGILRLYIDGILVAQTSTSVVPFLSLPAGSGATGIGIGNAVNNDFPMLGEIDDVVLYSRALSAAEVQDLVTGACQPNDGLALWVRADAGATLNGSAVTQWTDQSGNNRLAVQSSTASQPMLISNAVNGLPAVRFDGIDDFLTFNLPVNGLTGMTMMIVAANTVNHAAGSSQAEHAALFWNETPLWGTVYLTPLQSKVHFRFGTTQIGNQPVYTRPVTTGTAFTISTAVKNGSTESLYVNGSLVLAQGGKLTTIAGCRDTGNIGRGYNDNTYYSGDIAEVLVYTRALTSAERQTVESYLCDKYAIIPASIPQIMSQPANVSVFEPNEAFFSVTAASPTALSYQWRRGGRTIPGATNSAYTVSRTSQATDNGAQFDVIVSNLSGSVTSSLATLTVYPSRCVGAQIVAQPTNVTVTAPNAAAFSLTATGRPPLRYQWYRLGTVIPGATNSTYVLSPTKASDSGVWFQATVTNECGMDCSAMVRLTVNTCPCTPPRIVEQPRNVSVTSPYAAAFSVTATSSVPVFYQWYQYQTPIAGATNTLYVLYPTRATNNGTQFSVVVSNAYGMVTSAVVTLTVITPPCTPPQFTVPLTATVISSNTIMLSFTATGSPPLSYQWRRNGMPLWGATNSSYLLNTTTPTDTGAQFSVVVSNACGMVTNSVIMPSVNTLPQITTQPTNVTVLEPAPASFSVTATGSAPLAYQWRRNGWRIWGAIASSYTLNPTSMATDHGAQFDVVVSNSSGSVTSVVATLIVLPTGDRFPPGVLTQPADVTVVEPAPATFQVEAMGIPPLSYQWYKGAASMAGATTSTLSLSPTALANNDLGFWVVITNSYGSVTSRVARLTVIPLPRPLIAPRIDLMNTNFHLSFQAFTGHTYEIETSTNLADWVSIWGTNGTGAPVRFTDPNVHYEQRFYRIKTQ